MTVSRVFFCAASMDGERRNLVRYENGVTYVRANPAAPFTTGEKARRFAMVATTVAIVAAVCLVVGGHGGKVSPRVGQRNVHCIHLMAV